MTKRTPEKWPHSKSRRSRIGRRQSRGAAMVEGAVIFPILILLYGCMMMSGRAHMRGLAMQQEARAKIWATCVAPAHMNWSPYGGTYMSAPSGYPPIEAPDSERSDFHNWNIDGADSYRPDAVVSSLPAMRWGDVDVKALTLMYYRDLAGTTGNLDELFRSLRGLDQRDMRKTDYTGAYINGFTGEAKGFSAHFCQRIQGDPQIFVNEYSVYDAFQGVQNYLIPFLPAESIL